MFHFKEVTIASCVLVLCALAAYLRPRKDPFREAVAVAQTEGLTQTHAIGEGVPYYAAKTLDPVWGESASTPLVSIPQLQLTDQWGSTQNEKLFDGKVTFVAFFFSSCSGFCPTLLKNLQRVERALGAGREDVQYVAVSVDPARDTPENLRAYAQKMGLSAAWTLLTGDEAVIYALARETFAAEAFRLPRNDGQFAHSEHFYVLDEKKRLRGVLKGTRIDVAEKAQGLLGALALSAR